MVHLLALPQVWVGLYLWHSPRLWQHARSEAHFPTPHHPYSSLPQDFRGLLHQCLLLFLPLSWHLNPLCFFLFLPISPLQCTLPVSSSILSMLSLSSSMSLFSKIFLVLPWLSFLFSHPHPSFCRQDLKGYVWGRVTICHKQKKGKVLPKCTV